MSKWLLQTLLLAFIAPTWASDNTLSPDHFTWHTPLSDTQNSLREVVIPTTLLERMERDDLGDIRVFNSEGQAVPHQFSSQQAENQQSQQSLNFFPFTKKQAENPANIQIKILQEGENQTVAVNSQKVSIPAGENEYQYIITNPERSKKLCKLTLDWQQAQSNQVIALSLDSSNDLQNWQQLQRTATISKLDYADSQLLQPVVKFPCTTTKYLRLTWKDATPNIHLVSLTGHYQSKTAKALQTIDLGKPQVKNTQWHFEKPNAISFVELRFKAPQDGLLYKGTLYSRPTEDSQWRYQTRFLQYRLQLSNALHTSSAIELRHSKDRYWKAELEGDNQFTASQLPTIEGQWQQQTLIYLAKGAGPFLLAYGNADIENAENTGINNVIQSLQKASEKPTLVALAETTENTKRIEIQKSPPWSKLGLWLVLLLGTAVLGYMAYGLYRQMNGNKDS